MLAKGASTQRRAPGTISIPRSIYNERSWHRSTLASSPLHDLVRQRLPASQQSDDILVVECYTALQKLLGSEISRFYVLVRFDKKLNTRETDESSASVVKQESGVVVENMMLVDLE